MYATELKLQSYKLCRSVAMIAFPTEFLESDSKKTELQWILIECILQIAILESQSSEILPMIFRTTSLC